VWGRSLTVRGGIKGRPIVGVYPPTPCPFRKLPISPRIDGSSIDAGMVHRSPSATFFIVPRNIFPDRVLGSRATVMGILKAATGGLVAVRELGKIAVPHAMGRVA
jgi:hypothetical protein